jgi:hypothetical protein
MGAHGKGLAVGRYPTSTRRIAGLVEYGGVTLEQTLWLGALAAAVYGSAHIDEALFELAEEMLRLYRPRATA